MDYCRRVGFLASRECVALSKEWKTFRLPLAFKGRLKGLRFILSGEGAKADIRNARVLTTDGSLMMQYQFTK